MSLRSRNQSRFWWAFTDGGMKFSPTSPQTRGWTARVGLFRSTSRINSLWFYHSRRSLQWSRRARVRTKWTHWFISCLKWNWGSWEWHVSDNTHTVIAQRLLLVHYGRGRNTFYRWGQARCVRACVLSVMNQIVCFLSRLYRRWIHLVLSAHTPSIWVCEFYHARCCVCRRQPVASNLLPAISLFHSFQFHVFD